MSYYKYNIRSINKYQFDKKEKTPKKFISRIKKNNRSKYVWLAMSASKDFNTGNKIILREIRLEKGRSRLNLNEKKEKKQIYKIGHI